ncbi:hypothetical protein HK102_004461, partial [Quaeritorhiza haematococci]
MSVSQEWWSATSFSGQDLVVASILGFLSAIALLFLLNGLGINLVGVPAHKDGGKDGGEQVALKVNRNADCKMVLVIRTDLEMTKGKVAAQCSHATLANYKAMMKTDPQTLAIWERNGQTKVTLKIKSEEEMLALQEKARKMGLCARSIQDAGRTQIAAGSRTVLAVGP